INGQTPDGVTLKRYRADAAADTIVLEYAGAIDYGLSDQREEYTRGFRETAGVIGPEGVYLAGSGFWYPQLDTDLIEFSISARSPEGWQVISQGAGTSRDAEGVARWTSEGAMDEIYLVGGPLQAFGDSAGAVETLVYLHERDEALAAKYLAATAQYLEMYRGLIGPYPYGKFALVENFWETGYGMPSFTLLGPTIIRFPFIITSSYPHEILHNWWGNSVFVDYPSGNWCEGLTAYLADHLMQEQRGGGAAFRQSSLQRFRDFVREGRDFPLTEFRSRHDAATEAVGYGKTLMGFHMLRRQLGDEVFIAALRRFYQANRGRQASFGDLQAAFEKAAAADLSDFFTTWTQRAGAPSLAIAAIDVQVVEEGYRVSGTLRQTQTGDPYPLQVPILVQGESATARALVSMGGREASFTIALDETPLALHVDPAFDLFRLLDPRETPPSVGQVFGEPAIVAVLPAAAAAAEQAAYRELIAAWETDNHRIRLVTDAQLDTLPEAQSLWLFGRDNQLLSRVLSGLSDTGTHASGSVHLAGTPIPAGDHSFVAIYRHPANVDKAVGWLALAQGAAQSMAQKLPHYGKYSYLAFQGAGSENTLKGQWPVNDSPLAVDLSATDGDLPAPQLQQRQALAELPAVFDQASLMQHVEYLAAEARQGRGVGTQGLDDAAEYIAAAFA
ncbi:MAG TPA: M1 family aminopeptidase, partial [Gemmatimonadota bacterium]|nr:M1 family aminopeptidase [Gemmatimonadota bacterium]